MSELVNHTPGPWVAVYHPDKALGSDVSTLQHGIKIAECGIPGKGRYPRKPEEIIANARLIAAAPELLAALKRIVRERAHGVTDAAWDDADEAIARATGGTS